MKHFKSLKKECYQANMQLPALGLVLFTFGNVSMADHKNKVFAIKPSGVPYSELTPQKMVIVDFDGRVIDGKLRPSSDTKTHAFLYKNWSQINTIVHTHSTYATAWAQAQREIPIYGTTPVSYTHLTLPTNREV